MGLVCQNLRAKYVRSLKSELERQVRKEIKSAIGTFPGERYLSLFSRSLTSRHW
jgi:hypothetical protein